MNILVMGSDSRDGAGNNIDGLTGGGERSDTTIMIHLSADRQSAYGISIPRDSLVDRPDCIDEDGDTIPGATGAMWNEAFSVGGAACTIRQFEQLTDIRINNYVVVDFRGFQVPLYKPSERGEVDPNDVGLDPVRREELLRQEREQQPAPEGEPLPQPPEEKPEQR